MNLQITDAHFGHGRHQPVLTVPSWRGESGGVHVMLGSNGSGKSTFLRSVLGVLPLIQGQVELVDGGSRLAPDQTKSWSKHMAYVPSTPPRGVGLTVREVLALSGDVDQAVKDHPKIGTWLGRRLSRLSDGQSQQVMVARAALQSSNWIVLDEPTAFLDVSAQRALWEMLGHHVDRGGSVLMATHDLRGVCRWRDEAAAPLRDSSSWNLLEGGTLHSLPLEATLDQLESRILAESKD